jgi:hypothetical protein
MPLADRGLLRLDQHGFCFVAHLLDALEYTVAAPFGPSHGRQQ